MRGPRIYDVMIVVFVASWAALVVTAPPVPAHDVGTWELVVVSLRFVLETPVRAARQPLIGVPLFVSGGWIFLHELVYGHGGPY
ncbi:hypothetical protein [Halobaculum sp. D14]|uniref:hypothetical protein n=1 Tax=Halobaculum sp. D14 TaxID=3421642 RepID=UPI003EBBF7CB